MKINWPGVWRALDPRSIVKRYEVEEGSYSGGLSKFFWFRSNAEQYYNALVANQSSAFIRLVDWFIVPDKITSWGTMGTPTTLANFERGDKAPVRYL